MMRQLSLFCLMNLLLIVACTLGGPATEATATASPQPSPMPTPTTFIIAFPTSEAAVESPAGTERLSNMDEENRRLIDTSLASINMDDTVNFQFTAAIILTSGEHYGEIVLHGNGALFGLATQTNQFGYDISLESDMTWNDQRYNFLVNTRLTSGQAFIKVFADNFNDLGETRQTPWLALDLEEQFSNLFNTAIPIDTTVPISPDDFNLPEAEDFFGLLSFSDFIITRRLPDVGEIAIFEREVDIPALAGSPNLLELLLFSDKINNSMAITEAELEQITTALPELIQELFPQLALYFSQEVNLSNTTLNKLAMDFDLELDTYVLSQMLQTTIPTDNLFTNIDVVITFSGFGDPVTVLVPDDYIPIESYTIEPLPTPVQEITDG